MALRNPCFKDQNWSHLREPVERERGESKEEEKKKKKKRRSSSKAQLRYGNYFEYEFCMDHMEFKA